MPLPPSRLAAALSRLAAPPLPLHDRHHLHAGTFPGLRVVDQPSAFQPRSHEESRAGTFDVVWEASDWQHNRLLHTRSTTGCFPPPGALTRAVMSVILGPGMPLASLREWQPLLLRALWGIHFHRRAGYGAPG